MRFFLSHFLFVFLLLTTCFGQETSDFKSTKEVNLSPFSTLRVYSGIEVKLIPSQENKAVLYGDNIEGLVVSIKNGVLKIKLRMDTIFKSGYNFVELFHSEPVDLIDINQGASFSSDAIIKQTFLELKVNEDSEFRAAIETSRLEASVTTGSDLFIQGRADSFDLSINTSGKCDAENLITQQTKATVLAGGRAKIHAQDLIQAKVTAGGRIEVFGSPKKQLTKKILSGKILFMD